MRKKWARGMRTGFTFLVSMITLFIASLIYSPTVSAVGPHILADFETGYPAGWGPYTGGGASITPSLQTIAAGSPSALPIQVGSNVAVSTTYNIPSGDWGGFSVPFATPQDWSNYDGLRFWFYGTNSGLSYQAEIFDNGASVTSAELFDYHFVDNSTGWRHIEIPFGAFTRATDHQTGGVNDGLTLTQMWGWAIPLPVGSSQFYIDNVNLYPGPTTPIISLSQSAYSVPESGVVTITAQLNITSTGNITVSYATTDGTATAGTLPKRLQLQPSMIVMLKIAKYSPLTSPIP